MQYETPQSGSKPMLSLRQTLIQCMRKYGDFSGRATRAEYWWWLLAVSVAGFILNILPLIGSVLGGVFGLAVLLPSLAVTARRLHDINRTGWWQAVWSGIFLVGWIPLVIVAAGLIFVFLSGDWTGLGAAVPVGGAVAGVLIVLLIGAAALLAVFIWMLLWLTRQGQAGPNRYGPDPRQWNHELSDDSLGLRRGENGHSPRSTEPESF